MALPAPWWRSGRLACLRCCVLAAAMAIAPVPSIGAQGLDGSDNRHDDAFWYGRFAYGLVDAPEFNGPAFIFGRRIERGSVGLDLTLFAGQTKLIGTSSNDLHQYGGTYTHAYRASLMTVKALYLLRPGARASPYLGAGAGWSAMGFGHRRVGWDGTTEERWRGHGAEGNVTIGYAMARDPTSTRMFVEIEGVLPLYDVDNTSETATAAERRRTWAAMVSVGAGW